jgi:hypothetical protein
MSNLCDLCGKAKDGPRHATGSLKRPSQVCDAWIEGDHVYTCADSPIQALVNEGRIDEIVREAMRAPLLREALREALDGWDKMIDQFGAPEEWRRRDEQRIAELRKKHLG